MSNEIAYQNKDIASKVFAERFKGKSLKVYGLDVPPVIQVLPTNIPKIQANELRIDNVFLMEDGTLAIIDYESVYLKENKHKYIRYINHVAEYYQKEWRKDVSVRMLVIYTADVDRSHTSDVLDVGCLWMKVESAYLSELNADGICSRLEYKVKNKIPLTEAEQMEFIVLPLAYKGKYRQNESIKEIIELVNIIPDEEKRVFILSGIAVFTDKIIEKGSADEIRRLISMTKVGQLFEQEKEEYAKEKTLQLLVTLVDGGKLAEEAAADALKCTVDEFNRKKNLITK